MFCSIDLDVFRAAFFADEIPPSIVSDELSEETLSDSLSGQAACCGLAHVYVCDDS